jgi:hypothetical protein
MDESVRGRLRAAAPDGLTSPEQVTTRRMAPAATRKPAASGNKDKPQNQSAARPPRPGTGHEHHRQTVTQKMITRIYAVDRG